MSNIQVNSTGNVPTSALAYAMKQEIDGLNSDLNATNWGTYLTEGNVKDFFPGKYYCAHTVLNLPTEFYYFVTVESYVNYSASQERRIIATQAYGGDTYIMTFSNNTWSAWEKYAKSSDLNGLKCHTINDIYAGNEVNETTLNNIGLPYGGLNIWNIDTAYKNAYTIIINGVAGFDEKAAYGRGIILSYYKPIQYCELTDHVWSIY